MTPLPPQPSKVGWPTLAWATGPALSGDPERLELTLDRAFAVNPNASLALSLAFVAIQGGRIVAERYGPGVDARTRLVSWSVAKSITQCAVALAVEDGVLDPASVPVAPEWDAADDPRRAITLDELLAMRSGLEFNEDYLDAATSHCLEMLWGSGADDVAHYAASLPLVHAPGSHFNYSSGTTNILSRAVSRSLAGTSWPDIGAYLRTRLFDRIGMTSAELRYDAAGTWVGSSYVYATARDFARFGYLYLRGGRWETEPVLSEAWVGRARTELSQDPDDPFLGYSNHWWIWHDDRGTFAAQGYEGQLIAVVPSLDLVIVRLGKTPAEHRPALFDFYRDVADAFTD